MLGILLAATVVASPPPPAAPPPPCPAASKRKIANTDRVGPRKLGDLPDGAFYHAVLKEAGGCPIDEVLQNGRWVDRWSGSPRLTSAKAHGEGR